MYSSGLTLGPAAILNQNPFFEMAYRSDLPQGELNVDKRVVCHHVLIEYNTVSAGLNSKQILSKKIIMYFTS